MKLDAQKIKVAMANEIIGPMELIKKVGISYGTFKRIIAGEEVRCSTAGKIAKTLNISVEELILN